MSDIKELLCVTDEEKQHVLNVYQKTENDIKAYMYIIKEWISKQPHLPQNQDENRLERLLLRNKFRIEQTKQKLERYYTLKGSMKYGKTFLSITNPKTAPIHKSGYYTPMPLLSKKVERIVYLEHGLIAEDFNLSDLITYSCMLLELCVTYDYSVGDRLVLNLEHLTLGHLARTDIVQLINFVKLHQDALSGRYLGLELVNGSGILEPAMKMFKLVFPSKLYNKIRYHSSLESLYDVVDKKSLPSEVGGEAGSCRDLQEKWHKVIRDNEDYLRELSETTSNEKLRIGPCSLDDGFGVDGSFKKLNLD